MNKVYLETSFISYLVSRPSRDLIVAANQRLTLNWWENRRTEFDLYLSQPVLDEIRAGDAQASRERLDLIQGIPFLDFNQDVVDLAKELMEKELFPPKSKNDALHVAVATIHVMDFLLTWNCRHIANAEIIDQLERICLLKGLKLPRICTPAELLGR
jgi:predicted nucleic acid-binding protein